MAVRDTRGKAPFMSYQPGSGSDEVLRPTLMVVSDGRSYRKLTDEGFGPRREIEGVGDRLPAYVEEDECPREEFPDDDGGCGGEEEDLAEQLKGAEPIPGGGIRLRMDIPEVFYRYIIGRQGTTKRTIENDTGCRITVPGRGRTGDVVVEGRSERSVVDAKRRLEMVVWSNRLKEPITHFISIPLNLPSLMERMRTFQREVMAKCSKDEGICDEVFQIPEKFHVTVGVMRLFSKDEEEKAIQVMRESLKHSISHLGSEPAVIKVHGLDCMNDDSSAVSVLFGKLALTDASDRLQKLVDSITHYFYERAPDLMTKEFNRNSVKLHATVMNASFAAKAESSVAPGARPSGRERFRKKKFNAANVFKEFGDFEFGEVPLEVLHLSKRGDYGPDGFYTCIEKFHLNSFITESSHAPS